MNISRVVVGQLIFCLVWFWSAGQGWAWAEERKPNFVLIVIDDLGYGDIGPFGSQKNRTPQLDRLAREGMKFTSFYGAPVCTPSRASFMTGCYARRVSLPNVLFPAATVGLHPQEPTVASLLRQLGYATMCIGKWHLGDQPIFFPSRHGFDHYFGLPYSNDMGGPEPGKAKFTEVLKRKRPPLPLLRGDKVIEVVTAEGQSKLTERYTEEAVRFLEGHKDKQFFLYLAHTAIHGPLHPGGKFRGKSSNGRYGDWVEEMDWSVGRILDTLRQLNLDRRTLVLFSSDNGATKAGSNAPLRGYKGSVTEGGMRVPTLAWWPGQVPAGSVCAAVAANIDVLPTFLKRAGGDLPKDHVIDGQDLWPLLSGQGKESPHQAFFYFGGSSLRAVRSGPWKLHVLTNLLFNLDQDLGETTNLADEHPDIVKKLQEYAVRMEADLGAAGKGVRPPGRVADPQPLTLEPAPKK